MPTINYKEKSLLEIAIEVVKSHNRPQPIMQIAKETMELKGLKSTQGQQVLPQFLADFMESGYFVFCGDGMWDLKERQPLSVLDKDGSDYEIFGGAEADEVAANELKSEDYYDDKETEPIEEEDDIDDDDEEDDDISSYLKETESKSYAEDTEISSEEAVTGYEEDEAEEDEEEENLGEEDSYEKVSNFDF